MIDSRGMSGFSGHPRGLYVLFGTELWERYGFYSMMAILTLYMDEHLRFSQQLSGQVYGGYIGAVYFTPLLGGFLADRVLGYNRSVVIGAVLMGVGYVALASGTLPLFFTGLGLVALGSGFLKPNISTIVGNLYRDKPQLRDSAFNLFYMGINTGAFLAPIGVAWLRARYGWHVAIASSAVGMLLALVTFLGFNRHISAAGQRVQDSVNPEADPPADEARRRTVALLVIFAIAVIFWIAFYQNGFTLTFWARDYTDRVVLGREISPETFQSVNPLGIILFSPLLVLAWGWLRDRGREPSTPGKILIGILLTSASFAVMVGAATAAGAAGRVSPMWLVSSYAFIALGEICLSPMGLSLVSKVAPPSRRGLLMGGWFVATSLGGYFSGSLGTRWGTIPHAQFFLFVTLMTVGAALVLLLVLRFLRPVFARALAEHR
jgi:POT family proton-dependent oligopeptide transporter